MKTMLKRIFPLLISLALVFGMFPAVVIADSEETNETLSESQAENVDVTGLSEPELLGDLDKDGRVTVSDIVMLRIIIMSGSPTEEELALGDLDKDGKISVSDIVFLRGIIMGLYEDNISNEEDFLYEIIGDKVTIKSYIGNSSQVIIPETIQGYPVTSIGAGAFFKCKISSIIIPDSVTDIGEAAFAETVIRRITIPESVTELKQATFDYCENLEEVVLPDTITNFDKFVFGGCTALRKINIPKGLKDLGYMTFIGSGIEEIALPGTLEDTGYATFEDCKNLKTVIVEDGLLQIGEFSFYGCPSLEEIILPDSLQMVGSHAFADCQNLKKVVFPRDTVFSRNPIFSDDSNIFFRCPQLTVYGYKGSDAETYALERGIDFVERED